MARPQWQKPSEKLVHLNVKVEASFLSALRRYVTVLARSADREPGKGEIVQTEALKNQALNKLYQQEVAKTQRVQRKQEAAEQEMSRDIEDLASRRSRD